LAAPNEEGGTFAAAGLGVPRAGVAFDGSAFDVRAGVRVVEDAVDLAMGVLGSEAGACGDFGVGGAGSNASARGDGVGAGEGSGSDAGSDGGVGSSTLSSTFGSSVWLGASGDVTSDPTLSTDIRFQLVGGLTLPAGAAFALGGHSRFSLASARAASPDALKLDVALRERAPGGVVAVFALCCSNRPMRF
jgi:hypothetical protein